MPWESSRMAVFCRLGQVLWLQYLHSSSYFFNYVNLINRQKESYSFPLLIFSLFMVHIQHLKTYNFLALQCQNFIIRIRLTCSIVDQRMCLYAKLSQEVLPVKSKFYAVLRGMEQNESQCMLCNYEPKTHQHVYSSDVFGESLHGLWIS